jgi:hypothetical protein
MPYIGKTTEVALRRAIPCDICGRRLISLAILVILVALGRILSSRARRQTARMSL